LLAGAAWAGAELARARLLAGDPFGLFGYSQVPVAHMVQIADVTGVYGISFVLAAVNVALAELWLALGWHRGATRAAVAGVALSAAVVVVVAGYGAVRLHAPADFQPARPPTRVAIAQGNLDVGAQWSSDFYGLNLDSYLRLTLEALGRGQPALVFWPESAMTFFLEDEPRYQSAIGHVLASRHIQLVAGGPRRADSSRPVYTNTAFLIAPGGNILAAYDKQRLLPFAENFPFGGVDLLRRKFARVREFTPGGAATLLPTVAGAAGVVICNEVMFGETVADRVRAGATYIVNLANDSWLGDPQYAAQVFDMARLRAVEQRRYLVRASTSGPSAIVDPFGHVLASTPPESRATIGGIIQAGP
jgi:apolipoprotein N-acyltransferase